MSTRTATADADPIIESRDDLLAVFSKGEKPKERWRIGTEHEKLVYARADRHAPSYEESGGIHTLLILLKTFPKYERRDEVLFSLAYDLEDVGRGDEAVGQYRTLIRDFPSSKYAPDAWLEVTAAVNPAVLRSLVNPAGR